MELKQLEYFLTVSNLKSFTRAAEQLYISQPSVTTAIRRLEDELGIVLFERNKKQAVLTPEGEVFYSHISIVIDDVSKATQKAAELRNLNSGCIKLGISPVTSLSVAAFLLAKFRTIYPELKITFVEDGSYTIKKLLEEERVDLGLVIGDDNMDALDFIQLGQQELVAYTSPFHPWKNRKSIPLAALKHEAFIAPTDTCALRHILDAEFDRQNFTPRICFETNSIQMVKHLILSGSGVALLPKDAFDGSALHAVMLSSPLTISVGLAKKKPKHLSHAAQTLFKFFANSFPES